MFMHLAGCGIKSMCPIFKNSNVNYHSKANLDEKFCLVKSLIPKAQN